MIPMPPRHSVKEKIVRAVSKCLFTACARHYPSSEISAVAETVSGGTPDTGNPAFWDGDVVWVTPKDLGHQRDIEVAKSERHITTEASARLLPVGTVLLSSRAPIGHLGISAVPLSTNQAFKNIVCSDAIFNRYLFHMLRASIEELDALGRGNTFKEIPARTVATFAVPLPPVPVQRAVASFLDILYLRQVNRPSELPELPGPLREQRRIVARIEELAAKTQEARRLRDEVIHGCDALCRSMIFGKPDDGTATAPMGAVLRLREPDVDVRRDAAYTFAGVYCFGEGVFRGATKLGMEFEYSRLTLLRTGNFVYPKLMAWEGALGVVPPECDGLVVSPEFPVFEIDQSRALPETLDVYFRTPSVWPRLAEISTGTNVRRRRLHPSAFLRFQMALPKMETQLKLREVKKRVDVLKRLHAETAAELDALLPSILDRAFKGEL